MNFLTNARCYLSGPIQHDTGENWRIAPIKTLRDRFGINLFDPFSDPKQQWVPALRQAQAERDYDTMARIAKSFVRKDLAVVDRADFIIAYLPKGVQTTGTHHEIINSNNAKKPTLLVTNGDIAQIPLWYFGFIPATAMFGSWEALYEYLEEVHTGKHCGNNRWAYVCGAI